MKTQEYWSHWLYPEVEDSVSYAEIEGDEELEERYRAWLDIVDR